jgi:hypothetical protein
MMDGKKVLIGNFPRNISRKYLRMASVYRRAAGGKLCGYDFSLDSLVECYNNETFGTKVSSKRNGYIFGKWNKDIAITTWREDILKGDSCKVEYYTPITKWYAEPALKNLVVPTWFPYEYIMKERNNEN